MRADMGDRRGAKYDLQFLKNIEALVCLSGMGSKTLDAFGPKHFMRHIQTVLSHPAFASHQVIRVDCGRKEQGFEKENRPNGALQKIVAEQVKM